MATPSQDANMPASKNVETPIEVRKLSIAAEEVREAIEVEHALTFWEAVRLYPKAIGWSMYFSLGVIMLGTSPLYAPTTFANPKIASKI
jgi:SP family general alpha glucoside:H+ symporter-like MFS transporter